MGEIKNSTLLKTVCPPLSGAGQVKLFPGGLHSLQRLQSPTDVYLNGFSRKTFNRIAKFGVIKEANVCFCVSKKKRKCGTSFKRNSSLA